MKKTSHLLLSLFILLSVFFACRKFDKLNNLSSNKTLAEKFLQLPPGSSPVIKRIAHHLELLNQKHGFLNTIGTQDGLPVWNKPIFNFINTQEKNSENQSSVDDTIVYIPLVLENSSFVNAFIYARLDGAIHLELHRANDYSSYGFGNIQDSADNAERLALQIMLLDKEVFGHTTFKLLDERLFAKQAGATASAPRLLKIENNNSTSYKPTGRWDEGSVTWCTNHEFFYHCNGQGACLSGICDNCPEYCISPGGWVCETVTYYYFVSDDPGTGGGGQTGGGGGSSGGGGSGQQQCNPTPELENGLPPCPHGNTTGWMPVIVPENANQHIIDSLQGYPCAQSILSRLPSINDTAKAILKDVFGVDSLVNITFKADSTLPLSQNASTQVSTIQFDPATGYFNVRIRINTWVLKNSSTEFIAKTMFHEAIHAFIDYHWKKYTSGLMDSTTFKQMFPKIWDYKKTPFDNIAQHTQIAHSYVDDIMAIVKSFNSQIADSTNKGISWSGLFETQAWKDLGNDTVQLNRLRTAARSGTASEMTALKLKKCE